MDSYEDMHHQLSASELVPPGRCTRGSKLYPQPMLDGIVTWLCPCGHRIEKTMVELALNLFPEEHVRTFECQLEQKP